MVGAQHQVFVNGQLREKLTSFGTKRDALAHDFMRGDVADLLAFEFNLALCRGKHADNRSEQAGFPGAVSAQ